VIYGSGAADTEQKRLGAGLGGEGFLEPEGGFGCRGHPRFQWVPERLESLAKRLSLLLPRSVLYAMLT
jgi:hypothetical protein